MKNANIGVANLIISNKLKDSYFNNNLIEESKKLTTDFFDVVKNSPILQLEFKVFNNLENKNIENELVATRYIDNNIKLFEVYTASEINKEHEKLQLFLTEEIQDSDKVKLYEAISNLIIESVSDYDNINVDDVHDSFTVVLNHIKTPKKQLVESIEEHKPINEEVIEIAITKFNEKYESLNEDDKNLLKKLIKSNDNEKQELLEEYKKEMLAILEKVDKSKYGEMATKAIQKIKEMMFNSKTVNDDIIGLHEFKKEII